MFQLCNIDLLGDRRRQRHQALDLGDDAVGALLSCGCDKGVAADGRAEADDAVHRVLKAVLCGNSGRLCWCAAVHLALGWRCLEVAPVGLAQLHKERHRRAQLVAAADEVGVVDVRQRWHELGDRLEHRLERLGEQPGGQRVALAHAGG